MSPIPTKSSVVHSASDLKKISQPICLVVEYLLGRNGERMECNIAAAIHSLCYNPNYGSELEEGFIRSNNKDAKGSRRNPRMHGEREKKKVRRGHDG